MESNYILTPSVENYCERIKRALVSVLFNNAVNY